MYEVLVSYFTFIGHSSMGKIVAETNPKSCQPNIFGVTFLSDCVVAASENMLK